MKILKSGKQYYCIDSITYEEKIIYSNGIKRYLQVLVDKKNIVCYIFLGEHYGKVIIGENKHRDINRFEKILFYFSKILNFSFISFHLELEDVHDLLN